MFVVTGGGSGIGQALATALAMRGRSVLIVGRREQALVETASVSPLIQYFCADLAVSAERQRLVTYLNQVPKLDGLIHNAGVIEPLSPLSDVSESAWHHCLATNLDAPLFLTQALIPKLTHSRVLHIGSGAAYFPVASWAPYCVSKAALSMLTRCWQLECENIAFASVMPGIIDTNMQTMIRASETMQPQKHAFFMQLKQNQQLLTPETVAVFLCWLLLELDAIEYATREWDIYDKSHHHAWLVAPHVVPEFE